MAVTERVRELAAPLAEAASVELYDVEHAGGVVRVLVDSDEGIDLDKIAKLSRALGRVLDDHDVVSGRYTLEVSSPGLERRLRTVEHFKAAVGTAVKVKTLPHHDGPRRIEGVLSAAGDDCFEVCDPQGAPHTVRFDDVDWVRTVFRWGSQSRKTGGST